MAFWAFILAFWAFILALGPSHGLSGPGWPWISSFWVWGPGFCPGALLACGGSIPPGSLSLGARFPPGSLPIEAPRTKKVGIYGPALNPKRWKFGWLACRTAEWRERREVGPSSWDNPSKGNTRSSSTTTICRHPHTLQVCWWRHPCMGLTASPRSRRLKP